MTRFIAGLENVAGSGTLRATVTVAETQAQPRVLPSSWAAAAVCAAAGFVVFQFFGNAVRGYIDTASVFWWWGWQWFNPASESEHGPLVLAVAGWLGWRNLSKDEVRSEKYEVRAAVAAMGGALALHALGYAVQQTRISIVAVLIFSWGVLRLGGGRHWGAATAFPLALLVFAIPLEALDAVGFHLRLGVIAVTEDLARLAGIAVVRNGTQLFAPDGSYQYDVAAACSGVRSLMALLALAALIGYLGPRSWARRALVFALAFPLTFVGNVVRITAIVFAGEWFGQRAGEIVHDWAGFVVFFIVLGGVQIAANGLARREQTDAPTAPPAPEKCHHNGYTGRGWVVWGSAAGVVVLATVTVVFVLRIDRLAVRGEAGIPLAADGINPAALPVRIGSDWIGRATPVTPIEREMLPADTGYARRLYFAPEDPRQQVLVSLVLSGRDRSSIHRPELCLVGQGWTIRDSEPILLGNISVEPIPATLLRLDREMPDGSGGAQRVRSVFAYWFVGRERMVATTAGRMWFSALNRLRLQPDRWGYVVVQTVILPGETEADAVDRLDLLVWALNDRVTPPGP